VAADGWLGAEALGALIPRAVLPPLPADALRRVLVRTWSTGVGDVPPAVVPYLVFPWVVASDRLQALGWTPSHTNEETILETVDARPPSRVPSLRAMALVAGVAAAGIATGLTLEVLRRRRKRRRRRPSWLG